MRTQPDGGPAFPVPDEWAFKGMSLREWYAGKALEGVITKVGLYRYAAHQSEMAALILQQVDALLNELEKEKKV